MLIELIGIIAFITNVWANLLIARKSEAGWVVRLVSNVFWLAFGIAALSIANILNAVTFAGINIYGLQRWRKERLMPKSCVDHHRVTCRYCRETVKQCGCHSSIPKVETTNGLCDACAKQLAVSPLR
jgi:hypothetical protein